MDNDKTRAARRPGICQTKIMRIVIGLVVAVGIILPAAALAETAEERQACMSDAFRVCGSAIPSRDRVFACLMEKRADLSPPCRGVMERSAASEASARRKPRTKQRVQHLPADSRSGSRAR